jgi:hypothetical protein
LLKRGNINLTEELEWAAEYPKKFMPTSPIESHESYGSHSVLDVSPCAAIHDIAR